MKNMIDAENAISVGASKVPFPLKLEPVPQKVLQVEAEPSKHIIDKVVPYMQYVLEAGVYLQEAIEYGEPAGMMPQSPDLLAKTQRREAYEEAFNREFPPVEIKVEDMPRIVLLHGIGRNHKEFDDYISYLKAKGIKEERILALDFPKYGSQVPGKIGEIYNFENLGDWVIEELRRRGVDDQEKVSIFGQSLGALVSTYIAVNHHDRVANIIANSGPFRSSGTVVDEKIRKAVEGVLNVDDRALRLIELIKAHLPPGPTSDFLRDNSLEMLCQCYRDLFNIDWDQAVLKNIHDLPMIFITGEDDGMLKAVGYDGAKVIPNAKRVMEAGRGHGKPKKEHFWAMLTNQVKSQLT